MYVLKVEKIPSNTYFSIIHDGSFLDEEKKVIIDASEKAVKIGKHYYFLAKINNTYILLVFRTEYKLFERLLFLKSIDEVKEIIRKEENLEVNIVE